MSARARHADAERAARRRKGGAFAPFALFHADALVAAAVAMPRGALRTWLLANANWRPGATPSAHGRAALSYDAVQNCHPDSERRERVSRGGAIAAGLAEPPGRSSIADALRYLQDEKWLIIAERGTRPGSAGSAIGRASEYRIPAREGAYLRPPPWPPGLKRPQGRVRLHAARLRSDCAELPEPALRVLIFAVGLRSRREDGSVATDEPLALTLDLLSRHLRISKSTASAALALLVERGRLHQAGPASGRRAAEFELGRPYRRFSRSGEQAL